MIAEIFTSTLLIRLAASFVCSMAFAIVFKAAPRHLVAAGLSGMVAYFVYHLIVVLWGSVFAAAFFSTFAGAAFAEIYARLRRTPVTVILSAAIIPIVPGGDLYYTMQRALVGDGDGAVRYFVQTMSIALGIAGGIVVVAVAFRIFFDKLAAYRRKHPKA